MRKLALLLLLFFSCAVFPQSSDSVYETEWNMFQYGLNHSGHTYSAAPDSPILSWKFNANASIRGSPIVHGNTVYFGTLGGKFFALNASTGAKLWNYTVSSLEVHSAPAVAGGVVFFGSYGTDHKFYALNTSTGGLVWNVPEDGVTSAPAVYNGIVYFGSYDQRIHALFASNGTEKWNYSVANMVKFSSPAVADGVVYICDTRWLFALNASDGTSIWNRSISANVSSFLTSSPAVAYGKVYVGSDNNITYAFNATTGDEIWRFTVIPASLLTFGSPSVFEDVVYLTASDGRIYALNASTGAHIWNKSIGTTNLGGASIAGSRLYVGSSSGRLYALNISTGGELWNYSTNDAIQSTPAIVDGRIFFTSYDGYLYALGPFVWDGNLSGQLNVSQTCGSDINATALNFGSLVPGQTSGQQSLLLTNIGSVDTSDITLEGTDWIAAPATNFTANYTKWSVTDAFNYNDGTSVLNTPSSTGFDLANNASQAVYSRVQIPLGQATAAYAQNITLTTIC